MSEDRYVVGPHGAKTKIVGNGKIRVTKSKDMILTCDLCDLEFTEKEKYIEHMKGKTCDDWDNISDDKILNVLINTAMVNPKGNDIVSQDTDEKFQEKLKRREEFKQAVTENEEITSVEDYWKIISVEDYIELSLKADSVGNMEFGAFMCPSCKTKYDFYIDDRRGKYFVDAEGIKIFEYGLQDFYKERPDLKIHSDFLFKNIWEYDKHLWLEHGILVDRAVDIFHCKDKNGKMIAVNTDGSLIKRLGNKIPVESRYLIAVLLTNLFAKDDDVAGHAKYKFKYTKDNNTEDKPNGLVAIEDIVRKLL